MFANSKYFFSFVMVIEGNNCFGNGVIDQRIKSLKDVEKLEKTIMDGLVSEKGKIESVSILSWQKI